MTSVFGDSHPGNHIFDLPAGQHHSVREGSDRRACVFRVCGCGVDQFGDEVALPDLLAQFHRVTQNARARRRDDIDRVQWCGFALCRGQWSRFAADEAPPLQEPEDGAGVRLRQVVRYIRNAS